MSFNGNLQPSSDVGEDLTNKGDLHTFSTENTALPVGADTRILQANSATSTGLEWIVAGGGGIAEDFTVTTKTTTTPTSQTGFKVAVIDCTALTGGIIQCNIDGALYATLNAGESKAFAINPASSLNFVSTGEGKDFATGSYVQASSGATSGSNPYGLYTNSTGERWFHAGDGGTFGSADASSAWDITTLPVDLDADAGNAYSGTASYGVTVYTSGTNINTVQTGGSYGDGIKWSGITAWQSSTQGISWGSAVNLSSMDTTPRGFDLDPITQTNWFIMGQQNDKVYQLKTQAGMVGGIALYIETSPLVATDYDHSAQFTGNGIDCSLTSDGKFMALLAESGTCYGYTLGTAWDLTTASFTASFSTTAQSSTVRGVQIKDDGNTVFILDGQNGTGANNILEYDTSGAIVGTARIALIE